MPASTRSSAMTRSPCGNRLVDLGDDLLHLLAPSVRKFVSVILNAAKFTRRSLDATFVSDSTLTVPSAGFSPLLGAYDTAEYATMCFC